MPWLVCDLCFRHTHLCYTVKPVLRDNSEIIPTMGFQERLLFNAGQKYSFCNTFDIKLPSVIKIFVLSIFEWPLKTGFTVYPMTLSARVQHTLYPCLFVVLVNFFEIYI